MSTYEEQKANQQRYRNKRKERILRVMGGHCAICGYCKCNDALELHHIDPSKKEFTIQSRVDISWERTANELKKCILLCANCHRELHSADELDTTLTSSFDQSICDEVSMEIEAIKSSTVGRCCDCGCEIGRGATRCAACSTKHKKRVPNRPRNEELAFLVAEFGFSGVGRRYGVSEASIRKWCKTDGLPAHKAEICEYVKQLNKVDE